MRLLLAIGCNNYDDADLDDLFYAEFDADNIFSSLLPVERGDYAVEHSILLKSPSIGQVRTALVSLLTAHNSIDVFTFYFAGHGAVRGGSFYMGLRDTKSSALSLTAYSLADLFRIINEVRPAQTNIIIDACESGGLINDLGVLLKAESLEDANTPGITLLATSAQNQGAEEKEGGGVGTAAIVDCICGREMVQEHSATLDLVEISRHISEKLRLTGQNPVVWGLNLFEAPNFCRNPFAGQDADASMRVFLKEWSTETTASLKDHSQILFDAYTKIGKDWSPRTLADAVEPVLQKLNHSPELLARFMIRLSASALERAQASDDIYRRAELAATLAVCLLPYLGNTAVDRVAQELVGTATVAVTDANTILQRELLVDSDALLLKGGFGFSELFHLPLRLSRVLAWSAIPVILQPNKDRNTSKASTQYQSLVDVIIEKYQRSITAVTDGQAPYWCICLSALIKLKLTEQGEFIAGAVYNSLVQNRGRLLRYGLGGEQVLEYLLALGTGDFSQVNEALARPIETLTVLLRSSTLLGLEDVFDQDLWRLDGLGFMAYITNDFSRFDADVIPSGENLSWQIGYDIFQTRELATSWPEMKSPDSELHSALVMLASMLYPDRVPWYLLENADGEDASDTRTTAHDQIIGSPFLTW